MQIAGEEIERLRRQIMEQIDLTRTVEDEEVYQLIEAQVRDFARERMLTLGEREAVVQTLFYSLRKLDVLQELLEDPTITEIRKQTGKSPKPSPKSLGSSNSRVSHVIP